jgi:Tol biopolymer transport system component
MLYKKLFFFCYCLVTQFILSAHPLLETGGQWINLFTPNGNKFNTAKLVNMKHHQYKLESNVHFSPDGKWIIFRANFEGIENVYAVEIKKS